MVFAWPRGVLPCNKRPCPRSAAKHWSLGLAACKSRMSGAPLDALTSNPSKANSNNLGALTQTLTRLRAISAQWHPVCSKLARPYQLFSLTKPPRVSKTPAEAESASQQQRREHKKFSPNGTGMCTRIKAPAKAPHRQVTPVSLRLITVDKTGKRRVITKK